MTVEEKRGGWDVVGGRKGVTRVVMAVVVVGRRQGTMVDGRRGPDGEEESVVVR